jgi:hypothetical protein
MLSFACGHCGRLVFFENSLCLHCRTPQGFVPERLELVALEGATADEWHRCANFELIGCNWMVSDVGRPCRSCELTRTRPGDSDVIGMAELADAELGEPYRTVLGHLRHELGHYFQPLLVSGDDDWNACRELFRDERVGYGESLERHYQSDPPADWPQRFVSAYATMHPWEDWAETFAHYLHIRDTLQTAAAYGVVVDGPRAVADKRQLESTPLPDAAERGFERCSASGCR